MNNNNTNNNSQSSSFDANLQRSIDNSPQPGNFIPGVNFDAQLDEMILNRILRPKNLPTAPQGNEAGKMYWDTTKPTLKVWINKTIGWFDVFNRLYGNMHLYTLGSGSGVTITISASDTFYQVSPGLTGGLNNGFTFQNNRELKCLTAGKYLINWAMSVESGSNNQECEGTVMVNAIANTSLAAHTEIINLTKPATISGSGILSLNVNDLVSLGILNHTGATNLTIDHLTLSISLLTIT